MNLRADGKTPDTYLLHEMTGFGAERLIELAVNAVTGAAYGAK